MDNLTTYFRSYRECARTLWNLFLVNYPDGERAFSLIERELCAAMLQSQLATYQEKESLDGNDYYPGLRVDSLESIAEVTAMRASAEPGSTVWTSCEWRPHLVQLRFRALFDFDTFHGHYREFQYVDCIVVQSRDNIVAAGTRLLVDAVDVRIFDVSVAT